MSKLFFDSNGIKNDVIPSIENTIEQLKKALSMCDDISPTGGVATASVISGAKKNIQTEIDSLIKIKEWLEKCLTTYENRINSIESTMNAIKVDEIIKKEQWIKEITHEE